MNIWDKHKQNLSDFVLWDAKSICILSHFEVAVTVTIFRNVDPFVNIMGKSEISVTQ